MSFGKNKGFTFVEIFIVITIIGILAMIFIPNFAGFDRGARVAATQANLNTVRTAITVFRSKEGSYPVSLNDLTTKTYLDVGISKAYLKKMPAELISNAKGENNSSDQVSSELLSNTGGWAYLTDKAEVVVNISTPLSDEWSEYKGEVPSEW